jgi:hypothetical protein
MSRKLLIVSGMVIAFHHTVGVEKVDFSENGGISGDRKCLGGSKRSIAERPETILFLRFCSD